MVTKWLFTALTVWAACAIVLRLNRLEWGIKAHFGMFTVPAVVTIVLFYMSGVATIVLFLVAIWVKS